MAPKQDLDADTAKGNKGIPKLPSFGVTVVDAFEVRAHKHVPVLVLVLVLVLKQLFT